MPVCPDCQAKMEDTIHISQCPAATAQAQWNLSIQKLSQWLKDQGTALEIQNEIIMSQLEWWVNNDTPPANTEETFAEEQRWIEWDRMMDGWLMQQWRNHQEKLEVC